jgi:putative ABC transport system substrate-binding protein
MRRREFITLVGGAAVWPLSARAQQPALPIVGFLRSEPLGDAMHLVAAFRAGLKEAGFTEDQNVTIELRSAEGHADRLTVLVAELIRRPVAVIVANSLAAVAAATATSRVPIVFAHKADMTTAFGSRSGHSAVAARHRRRGDRIVPPMSALGRCPLLGGQSGHSRK